MKLLSVFFRNLFRIFVVMGFVFGALTVQAKVDLKVDLKEQVKLLNKSKSLRDMGLTLKKFFKSPGDQRQIDKDMKVVSKAVKKWMWRYELKGNEIAFRSNGRIQFSFKPGDMAQGVFSFNGQKFVVNPDLSYASHKDLLSKILNKKQSALEQLFVRKAQAILPLLLIAGAAAMVLVSSNAQAKTPEARQAADVRKCVKAEDNSTYEERAAKYCRTSGKCGDNQELYKLERHHFQNRRSDRGLNVIKNGGHGTPGYSSWRTLRGRMIAIVGNYSGSPKHLVDGHAGYRNFNGCMKAKTTNKRGWWAMNNDIAARYCEFGWDIYQNCLKCGNPWQCEQTPVVVAPSPVSVKDPPPEPVTCQCINNQWSPTGCTQPAAGQCPVPLPECTVCKPDGTWDMTVKCRAPADKRCIPEGAGEDVQGPPAEPTGVDAGDEEAAVNADAIMDPGDADAFGQ